MRFNRTFGPGLLLGVLAAGGVTLTIQQCWSAAPRIVDRTVTPRGELAADEKATIALFEQARESVVYISTSELVRDLWSRNVMEVPQGTGSGFIWDDAGHIVTKTMLLETVWNFHFDPKTKIVETHMSRLRAKVSLKGELELIHTIRGAGYVLRAPI